MKRVAVLVYVVVSAACVLLALSLVDSDPAHTGQLQPGHPVWPDALLPR